MTKTVQMAGFDVDADDLLLGGLSVRALYFPVRPGEVGVTTTLQPWGRAERYGAVGDGTTVGAGGGTDDTTSLLNMVTSSIALAVDPSLSPGKSYRTLQPLNLAQTNVTLRMNGARLIKGADIVPLQLTGHFDVVAVTAIATAEYNYTEGTSGAANATTRVSKVSVAALPPGLAVGDDVRIVSDDPMPFCLPNGGGFEVRTGEDAIVGAIVGTDVYLRGLLLETFATNVRLARRAPWAPGVDDGEFDVVDAGEAAGWKTYMVQTYGTRNSRVWRPRITRNWGQGIRNIGSARTLIMAPMVTALPNHLNVLQVGYGIDDCSSVGTRVIAPYTVSCRHSYTNSCDPHSAGYSEIQYYGRTVGARIVDGEAHGSLGGSWDTHLGARDIVFTRCRSMNPVNGQQALGGSFSARGFDILYDDCSADGGRYVAQAIDQGVPGGTDRVTLRNCRAGGFTVGILSAVAEGCTYTIEGGSFEQSADTASVDSAVLLSLNNKPMTLNLNGQIRFAVKTAQPSARLIQASAATVVNVNGDVTLDLTQSASVGPKAAFLGHADAVIQGDGKFTILSAAPLGSVFQGLAAGQGRIDLTNLVFNYQPTSVAGNNLLSYAYSASMGRYGTWRSRQVTMNLTADDQVPPIAGLADPEIYLQISCTAPAAAAGAPTRYQLGQLPNGYRDGQMLIINLRSPAAGGQVLLSGTRGIAYFVPIQLRNYDVIRLMYSVALAGWAPVGIDQIGKTPSFALLGAALGDADVTLTPIVSQWNQRLSAALTAKRTATLANTNAMRGDEFYIEHRGSGDFDYEVKDGTGNALIGLRPGSWAVFIHDSVNFQLHRYGSFGIGVRRKTLAYAVAIAGIDIRYADSFEVVVTDGLPFGVNAPGNAFAIGQRITIRMKNTTAGALGIATWNAIYKLAPWVQPAAGFNRWIQFEYDGTSWVECGRAPADIPN